MRRALLLVSSLTTLVLWNAACSSTPGTTFATATGGSDGVTGGTGGTHGETPSFAGAPAVGDTPTAVEAAAAMGKGFNLGQMFENTQHPRTFEAARAKIDAYLARGFRNVRIPITWTEAVGGDTLVTDPLVGAVNREHPRLAVIEEVVDYALAQPGIFVVINAHHEKGLKTEARGEVLERLWTDIVDIFGDRENRLLFEILNEPHLEDAPTYSAMAPEDLRRLSGLAYDAIRAVNPERIVLIGGNRWFAAEEMAVVWPNLDAVGGGNDPYLMATFHHYNPWTFCGDNQGSYDDPWTSRQQSAPMDTMQNWADTVGGGMPVYIGEWGVGWQSTYATMNCNNVRKWYDEFLNDHAVPKGQPTAVWDDGGWFRVFSHATNEWDNDLIECMTVGCEVSDAERFGPSCQ